mmetsp:Transcript_70881/g.188618  ORF Transcript_70881/g.188618 Transcript_70881/m.188618 type:complete len:82 (-) Transcript_70881:38-283(-)
MSCPSDEPSLGLLRRLPLKDTDPEKKEVVRLAAGARDSSCGVAMSSVDERRICVSLRRLLHAREPADRDDPPGLKRREDQV